VVAVEHLVCEAEVAADGAGLIAVNFTLDVRLFGRMRKGICEIRLAQLRYSLRMSIPGADPTLVARKSIGQRLRVTRD
jgi:hypothetical protein